jgi:hypothetical protein
MNIGDVFNPRRVFVGSFIPNVLMRFKGLSPTAKLCWARLAQYLGKDGLAYPSQETLGEEVGVTDRHIRDVLEELQRAGFIFKIAPTGQDKFAHKTNRYGFLWHSIFEDAFVCADREKLFIAPEEGSFLSEKEEQFLSEKEGSFRSIERESDIRESEEKVRNASRSHFDDKKVNVSEEELPDGGLRVKVQSIAQRARHRTEEAWNRKEQKRRITSEQVPDRDMSVKHLLQLFEDQANVCAGVKIKVLAKERGQMTQLVKDHGAERTAKLIRYVCENYADDLRHRYKLNGLSVGMLSAYRRAFFDEIDKGRPKDMNKARREADPEKLAKEKDFGWE